MCESGGLQGVVADRVSFIDALRWLRDADAGEEMPELVVNPHWIVPGGRSRGRRSVVRSSMTDEDTRSEMRKRLREKDLAA